MGADCASLAPAARRGCDTSFRCPSSSSERSTKRGRARRARAPRTSARAGAGLLAWTLPRSPWALGTPARTTCAASEVAAINVLPDRSRLSQSPATFPCRAPSPTAPPSSSSFRARGGWTRGQAVASRLAPRRQMPVQTSARRVECSVRLLENPQGSAELAPRAWIDLRVPFCLSGPSPGATLLAPQGNGCVRLHPRHRDLLLLSSSFTSTALH